MTTITEVPDFRFGGVPIVRHDIEIRYSFRTVSGLGGNKIRLQGWEMATGNGRSVGWVVPPAQADIGWKAYCGDLPFRQDETNWREHIRPDLSNRKTTNDNDGYNPVAYGTTREEAVRSLLAYLLKHNAPALTSLFHKE